jgi:hypothetical protein
MSSLTSVCSRRGRRSPVPPTGTELSVAFANVRTLGDSIEWNRARQPSLRIDEIVTQD